jgi:hypothetical protein
MPADIVPLRLPRPHAEALIHRLAKADLFALEPHCRKRMAKRGFTMRQVVETLRSGTINQGPILDECNDWRCRLKKRVAGQLVRVVVAIHDMSFLYVITVH